jgi:hypothetical protein
MENTKNMSIKIGLIDYVSMNEIQVYILKKRKLKISKKNLLGWIIQKAKIEILKK